MSRTYAETDMAGAWESGYRRDSTHNSSLNDAISSAKNANKAQGIPPTKACNVSVETEKGSGVPVKESATAQEPSTTK